MQRPRGLEALALFVCLVSLVPSNSAGPYVTETSGIRWNDVGGIRWNDVGVRYTDEEGIRWNDVGGIRWNDVGGLLFSDATGIRWNDVGGIRWNDVGGIGFHDEPNTGVADVDLALLALLAALPDTSEINVIVTYWQAPGPADLTDLVVIGVPGGTVFRRLPMVAINATKQQIRAIALLSNVRSIWADKTLSIFDDQSAAAIGLPDVANDPDLAPTGAGPSGAGVTVAVLDSGIDGGHPDLPFGHKLLDNVRLNVAIPTGPGFVSPTAIEGLQNTDLVLGHGTFVASVLAGTGQASNGLYAGVAPDASLIGLSAGDFLLFHLLEGFDWILDHQQEHGIRVVNCSWGTQGWFDRDDPINVATRVLHDAGIVVVFAAGNHGPSPDTLNPYAVAPWVIGVGSTRKDGALSSFSSRGIYQELLYHPTLVAPGEAIIAAKAALVEHVFGIEGIVDPTAGQSVPPEHVLHYTISSGTSFAAPHVAGVIARLLEAVPELEPREVKRILQQSATPLLVEDRAAVGAGALDAWAALTLATDPGRPFGTHVAGWLDERPYTIEHLAPEESEHTLLAGQTLSVPVSLAPGAVSWQLDLAWGDEPAGNDLDVRVLGPGGVEVGRAATLNGPALFARAEGLHLRGELPASLDVEVSFRLGTGFVDQPFYLHHESASATLLDFDDLSGLTPAELDTVTRAVVRGAIDGRGASFAPAAAITRGELARSLALASGLPQRVPSSRSFDDVRPGDAAFPYVETVAGQRARAIVLDPRSSREFGVRQAVRRIDAAVGFVRAAGLDGEARARAGEVPPVSDAAAIPGRLAGYVAIAVERGFIDPLAGRFEPSAKLTRLDACRGLRHLLDVRAELQQNPMSLPSTRAPERPSSRAGQRPAAQRADTARGR